MTLNFKEDIDFLAEESENLETPEINRIDKRVTGRTKQLTIKITPKLHEELKLTALQRKMLITEIIEKAFLFWKKKENND